jgi:hypothetical protein
MSLRLSAILLISLLSYTAFAESPAECEIDNSYSPQIQLNTLLRINVSTHDPEKFSCAASRWSLWLDGMPTGVEQLGCEQSDPAKRWLTFPISRTATSAQAESEKAWTYLLHNPFEMLRKNFQRKVSVSIRHSDGTGEISCSAAALQVSSKPAMLSAGLLVAGILLLLSWLAVSSDILRDAGPTAAPLQAGQRRTYSLARLQMAWWFGIVLSCYVFLWVILGDLPILSNSALWLMGMSGAAGAVAAGVDQQKQNTVQVSQGWISDLLTNANGVALHRFQMLAWTVVLGVIFIQQCLANLGMPEFDASTLALVGVSTGAYLGCKIPENQQDASPVPATDAGAQTTGKNGTPV